MPDRGKFFSSLKINVLAKKKQKKNKTKQTKHSHILDVWNKFKMKSLGHYYNLYLNTDVLLLADVFEKFITQVLNIVD